MEKTKREQRIQRHNRTRAKILGSKERPRISVFRSNKNIYVQVIDDESGKTLASVNSVKTKAKTKKSDIAGQLGESMADKMKELKISQAVFDKSGFKYHGRVKAVAEGLRKGGIKF